MNRSVWIVECSSLYAHPECGPLPVTCSKQRHLHLFPHLLEVVKELQSHWESLSDQAAAFCSASHEPDEKRQTRCKHLSSFLIILNVNKNVAAAEKAYWMLSIHETNSKAELVGAWHWTYDSGAQSTVLNTTRPYCVPPYWEKKNWSVSTNSMWLHLIILKKQKSLTSPPKSVSAGGPPLKYLQWIIQTAAFRPDALQ